MTAPSYAAVGAVTPLATFGAGTISSTLSIWLSLIVGIGLAIYLIGQVAFLLSAGWATVVDLVAGWRRRRRRRTRGDVDFDDEWYRGSGGSSSSGCGGGDGGGGDGGG